MHVRVYTYKLTPIHPWYMTCMYDVHSFLLWLKLMSHTSYNKFVWISLIAVSLISNGHRKINEYANITQLFVIFSAATATTTTTHIHNHILSARLVYFFLSGNQWITCNDFIDNCADEPMMCLSQCLCVCTHIYVCARFFLSLLFSFSCLSL